MWFAFESQLYGDVLAQLIVLVVHAYAYFGAANFYF